MSKPTSYFGTLLSRKTQSAVRPVAMVRPPSLTKRTASTADVAAAAPANQIQGESRPSPIVKKYDVPVVAVPGVKQVSFTANPTARTPSTAKDGSPGRVEVVRPEKGEGKPFSKANVVNESVIVTNTAAIIPQLQVASVRSAMEEAPSREALPRPTAVVPIASPVRQCDPTEPQSQEPAAIPERRDADVISPRELRLETAIAWPAQLDAVQRNAVRTAVERQVRERISTMPAGKSAGVQRIEVRVEQVNVRFDSPVPARVEAAKPGSRNTFGEFFRTRSLR